MLYKNQTIEENQADPIINQISPDAALITDECTELYYDDQYNYLFVHKDYVKCDSSVLTARLSHPSKYTDITAILKKHQTMVFMAGEDEYDKGYHIFIGVFSFPETPNNLSYDNCNIILRFVTDTAMVTIHEQKPNYQLNIINPVEGIVVYEHKYFCSIEQDAKGMAYEEAQKCPLEEGEHCAKLYRIWPNKTLHEVPGMPQIGLYVKNGKVEITTVNPFK